MKKYIIILTSFTLLLFSCTNWLDVDPSSKIKEEELFSTDSGFRNALIGCYTLFNNAKLYAGNLSFGIVEGFGQVYEIEEKTHSMYYASNYDYTNSSLKTNIQNTWTNAYTLIANANNILTNIEGKEKGFFLDDRYYGVIKGESLAIRAMMHFELLRLFADAPVVNDGSLAIPYVTELSKISYPQLTVKEVIACCLADLELAEELLYESDPISPINDTYDDGYVDNPTTDSYISDAGFLIQRADRMNYFVVKGYLARINLYAGNKTEAYENAIAVFENAELEAKGEDQRVELGGHLFRIFSDNMEELIEPVFTSVASDNKRLVVSDDVVNEIYETAVYGSVDNRLRDYFTTDAILGYDFCNRYEPFSYYAGTDTQGYFLPITPEEMYLIAAEVATSSEESLTLLNTLRNYYGIPTDYNLTAEDDIQEEIRKEYQKSLLFLGQIFHYYKRLNIVNPRTPSTAILDGMYNLLDYLPEQEYTLGGLVGPNIGNDTEE